MLRIIVEKFLPNHGEYWSNVYHIPGSTPSAAVGVGTTIANAERPLYGPHILITKFRIDDMVEGTQNFWTQLTNLAGTRSTQSEAAQSPLFVVARVDFPVADGGRPCRKYLRCIGDADNAGKLLAGPITALLQTYAAAIVNAGIVDPQGHPINSGFVWPEVAMRQLRRGSKKKVTP